MLKPLLFAALAAFGNAIFVYGQRGAEPAANPFLFTGAAVGVCTLLLSCAAFFVRDGQEAAYLLANWKMISISGFGFAVTFVGFFLLYSNFGASQYTLYAILSILTTSIGVGVFLYRESINGYQIAATLLAIAAIALFTYGRSRGA